MNNTKVISSPYWSLFVIFFAYIVSTAETVRLPFTTTTITTTTRQSPLAISQYHINYPCERTYASFKKNECILINYYYSKDLDIKSWPQAYQTWDQCRIENLPSNSIFKPQPASTVVTVYNIDGAKQKIKVIVGHLCGYKEESK